MGPGSAFVTYSAASLLWTHYTRATYLSVQHVDKCVSRGYLQLQDLYIPFRPARSADRLERDSSIHDALRESREKIEVRLSAWSRKLLSLQGYKVLPASDTDIAVPKLDPRATTSGVTISKNGLRITVQVGACPCPFGQRLGALGVLVTSRPVACSLEHEFMTEPHLLDNPAHIQSWTFRGAVASKEIVLSSSRHSVLVRLTIGHDATSNRDTKPTSVVKIYRLGIELSASPSPGSDPADSHGMWPMPNPGIDG